MTDKSKSKEYKYPSLGLLWKPKSIYIKVNHVSPNFKNSIKTICHYTDIDCSRSLFVIFNSVQVEFRDGQEESQRTDDSNRREKRRKGMLRWDDLRSWIEREVLFGLKVPRVVDPSHLLFPSGLTGSGSVTYTPFLEVRNLSFLWYFYSSVSLRYLSILIWFLY